jgi:hypothetical protein
VALDRRGAVGFIGGRAVAGRRRRRRVDAVLREVARPRLEGLLALLH